MMHLPPFNVLVAFIIIIVTKLDNIIAEMLLTL
jgi:hypothetical protein